MISDETLPDYAPAPAGYIPLELAVYRLALHMHPGVWEADPSVKPWYEGLGTLLHLKDVRDPRRLDHLGTDMRPRFQARLDSLNRAVQRLRELLRHKHVGAVHQRLWDGQEREVPEHRWAQADAPTWFSRGQVSVDGLLSDLFVEEAGFSSALQQVENGTARQDPVERRTDYEPIDKGSTQEQRKRALIARAKEILATQFDQTLRALSESGDRQLLEEHGIDIPRDDLRGIRRALYPEIRRGAPRKNNSPSKSPEK